MSVWPEETFARLRYLLGGLRPIETVYLRLSLGPRASAPIHGLTTCGDLCTLLLKVVRAFPGSMAWVTYFSAVALRLVLGPRLEAFSLPLLTLKKQGHLVSLNL
uniref:Uncharacterized protein n=1 Tax=Setaria italica TaxID=4555 RepID=K3Z2T8_SETIT